MPTNRSASIRVASIDAVDDQGRSQRQDYVVVEEPLAVKLSMARDGFPNRERPGDHDAHPGS